MYDNFCYFCTIKHKVSKSLQTIFVAILFFFFDQFTKLVLFFMFPIKNYQ